MIKTSVFGLEKPIVAVDTINDVLTAVDTNADICEMKFVESSSAIANIINWDAEIASATATANSAHINSVEAVSLATDADTTANEALVAGNDCVSIANSSLTISNEALTVADAAMSQVEINLEQINNIVSGENPEVVDIRTAIDGTVYPTAGDHVRHLDTEISTMVSSNTSGNTAINASINSLATSTTSAQNILTNSVNAISTEVNALSTSTTSAQNTLTTSISTLSTSTTSAQNALTTSINAVTTEIGTLSSLTTASRTNLVGAINELVTTIASMPSTGGGTNGGSSIDSVTYSILCKMQIYTATTDNTSIIPIAVITGFTLSSSTNFDIYYKGVRLDEQDNEYSIDVANRNIVLNTFTINTGEIIEYRIYPDFANSITSSSYGVHTFTEFVDPTTISGYIVTNKDVWMDMTNFIYKIREAGAWVTFGSTYR